MKKKVTIQDVADASGVSRAAVYAVLNPSRSTRIGVSDVVREKILSSIRTLGYIPNNSARSLVSGRTNNVGMLIPAWILTDIVPYFDRHGYMSLPLFHNSDPVQERRNIELFISRGVDAIIVAPVSAEHNRDIYKRVIDYGITLILIAEEEEGLPGSRHVIFNEKRSMELPVQFLVKNGVTRIGISDSNNHKTSVVKRTGFLNRALSRYPEVSVILLPKLNNRDGALDAARMISQMPPEKRPQAVVTYGDLVARMFIHALNLYGLKVPEDLYVTGIGDADDTYELLRLTTVRLPGSEMAKACYQTFEAAMAGKPGKLTVVEPQLIIRESAPDVVWQDREKLLNSPAAAE